jgi:hypothetical protein
VLLVAALFAATSCGSGSISIISPAGGSQVRGNVVTLHAEASGIDAGSTYAVFVDRGPVAPGTSIPSSADVIQGTGATVTVAGLALGRHVLTVVAADSSERRAGNAEAALNVTVDGPATTVTAPLTVNLGQPIKLMLNTSGVTIVDIAGDVSGHTAHYEVIVDGTLPRAGELIAATGPEPIRTVGAEVSVLPLSRGRHVIWIVLADGVDRALDPLVAAQAIVTVTA